MQLIINVDDESFKNILDTELKNVPSEQLQDIITSAIKEYLLSGQNLEDLLWEKRDGYYGGRQKVPTEFTHKLLQSCDYSGLQEVVNQSIDMLKGNLSNILNSVLAEMLARGLAGTYNFQSNLEYSIREELVKMNNSQNC